MKNDLWQKVGDEIVVGGPVNEDEPCSPCEFFDSQAHPEMAFYPYTGSATSSAHAAHLSVVRSSAAERNHCIVLRNLGMGQHRSDARGNGKEIVYNADLCLRSLNLGREENGLCGRQRNSWNATFVCFVDGTGY